MCLLAILSRTLEDAPLIVGANREEAYARQGTPPALHAGTARFVAGIDPVAGGTWLGVNQHGLLAAVTNGRRGQAPAQPRSRGLLVRDLLGCPDVTSASRLAVAELATQRYAGCNLLLADHDRLEVLYWADWLRVQPLPPGAYVLTHGNVNNLADARTAFALRWLADRPLATVDQAVGALQSLCALNGDDGQPPITLRGKDRGTVSSSVIVLGSPPGRGLWRHSQGAPDQTPYQDCSHLLRQLGG